MTTKKFLATLAILGSTALFASDGASLYKPCIGCHGSNGEKPALGKSEAIKGWDSAKVQEALIGYKKGTYGKAMKGVMKGQVARLSDADIKALSDYIATFK